MTRFRNKIGKLWKPREGKFYSKRYMKILNKLDEAGAIYIIQGKKKSPVFDCSRFGGCGIIYYNHNDDEIIFHDSLTVDVLGSIRDYELEFMMQVGEGEGIFLNALTGEFGYGEM